MRKIFLLCGIILLFPMHTAFAQNNAIVLGYGFGYLNTHQRPGKIEDDRTYNYLQLLYAREIHLVERAFLVLEPFFIYDSAPSGVDLGFGVLFRYYVPAVERSRFFFDIGGGGVYSTVDFKEQSIDALFILQAGLGWRWKWFSIEDRFRHYSNGGLFTPNHSINSNVILLGFHF